MSETNEFWLKQTDETDYAYGAFAVYRDLGPGTGMDLPRGLNALWTQGGLMIPMAPR